MFLFLLLNVVMHQMFSLGDRSGLQKGPFISDATWEKCFLVPAVMVVLMRVQGFLSVDASSSVVELFALTLCHRVMKLITPLLLEDSVSLDSFYIQSSHWAN